MKNTYILFLIFIPQIIFSQHSYNPDDYNCISNTVLNILELNNGDKIFYGSDGGVIRSIKNDEEWIQNYSGTKSYINSMITNEERILGVTTDGFVMSSDDNGDWWNYKKLATSLNGIVEIDDIIVTASNSDSLFFSSDNGNTWANKKIDVSSIALISLFNGNLIINSSDFKIYISSDLGNGWESLEVPFQFSRIDNENYSISNENKIAILNKDLTWTIIDLITNSEYLTYIIEGKNLITFSEVINSPNPILPKIKIVRYDLGNNTNELITEYESLNLGNAVPGWLSSAPFDVKKIENKYYLTTNFKTILSSEDLIDWEVLSNASTRPIFSDFIDDEWIIYPQASTLTSIFTTDKGATFKHTNSLFINYNNKKYNPTIISSYTINESEIFYLFGNDMISYDDATYNRREVNNIFGKSYDGGKTIEVMNDSLPKILEAKGIGNFNFLGFNKNKCYINYNYLIRSEIKENNKLKDSIFKNIFFVYDIIEEKIDTLNVLDLNIKSPKFFFDDEKIWLYGGSDINTNELVNRFSEIYLSNDNGKTFDKVVHFPYQSNFDPRNKIHNFYKSKIGRYFFRTAENLYELDTNNYSFTNLETGYDLIGDESFSEKVKSGNLEDQYFIVSNVIGTNQFESFLAKINFDSEIKLDILTKVESNITFFRNKSDDLIFYFKSAGGYFNLYKPIELERLKYYSSVEKTESHNYLWTYPPYPQPTNNIVKVDTYWDSALPFSEKDIEIYNITGLRVNTNETLTLQKESNHKGQIIWDLSSQNPGIYIMKITHGTETRVRKIMVLE